MSRDLLPACEPSLLDHAAGWARYAPRLPALTGNGERLDYGELDRRVQRTAVFLTETLGLQRGDRVALLAHNHVFFFELAFACFRTGLVLAPLNFRLAPPELAAILDLCQPGALFVDAANHDTLERMPVAPACPVHSLECYLSDPPAAPVAGPSLRWQPTGMEDPAVLLFTSGTTGRPKAAVLPGRQLFWNAINTILAFELTRRDSTLVYTPLFHTGAINVLAFPLFQVGGHVHIHENFDAAAILQSLLIERITTIFGVPTTLQRMAEQPAFRKGDLRATRLWLCGGAPLPVSLIRTYAEQDRILVQGFGMTEVGPNCFYLPADMAQVKAGSVGKPMPYAQAQIRVGDRLAQPGEVGELWLAGPHVCAGYFRNPQASIAAIADGWFDTGDLASQDEDGFFAIAGRKKEMFISGGENVYPAEVESVLAEHDSVAECAVVPMADSRWGEVGCAFVVPRSPVPQPASLRAYLKTQLAGYKVPKAFVFCAALPRNPSGKVMREPLKEEARRHAA